MRWYAFSAEELRDVDYECNRLTNFIPVRNMIKKHIVAALKVCSGMPRRMQLSRHLLGVLLSRHKNDRGCASSPHGGYQICGFYAGEVDRGRLSSIVIMLSLKYATT